jgi:primosomal protein N' (replication factor Y)
MIYYDVMLPVPAGGVYTYQSDNEIPPGTRVKVSLGRRTLTGILLKENTAPQKDIKYKKISEVLDSQPIFTPEYLELVDKLSAYYCTNKGLVLQGILSKSILESEPLEKEVEEFEREILTLNEAQVSVYDSIEKELFNGFSTHLVHGVTGSGKTVLKCSPTTVKRLLRNVRRLSGRVHQEILKCFWGREVLSFCLLKTSE